MHHGICTQRMALHGIQVHLRENWRVSAEVHLEMRDEQKKVHRFPLRVFKTSSGRIYSQFQQKNYKKNERKTPGFKITTRGT